MKREPFLSKAPSNTELTFTPDITMPRACPVPAENQQSRPMTIGRIPARQLTKGSSYVVIAFSRIKVESI